MALGSLGLSPSRWKAKEKGDVGNNLIKVNCYSAFEVWKSLQRYLEKEIWADILGSSSSLWDLRERKLPLLENCIAASFHQEWSMWHLLRKKSNQQTWGMLLLENSVCKVGPWLTPGYLDLERVPSIFRTVKWAHCTYKVDANNIIHAKRLLSLWRSGILVHAKKRVPTWPASSWKTQGPESLVSCPAWQHCIQVITVCCWRNYTCPAWLHGERIVGNMRLVSSDFTPVPFPFADFAVYHFTLINHSFQYDCILNPWVLLEIHQTWEWSWGPPSYTTTTW